MTANVALTDTFDQWRVKSNELIVMTQSDGMSNIIKTLDTTNSTSNTTGSIITAGGASFKKSVYIGENLTVQGNVVVDKDVRLEKILSKSSLDSKPDQSNEIINKINEVLDSKIRPAVARDGGDITFKSFTDGVVTVELKGSCSGCPSSIATLKQGVQNLLCHYIPEVKSVEAN